MALRHLAIASLVVVAGCRENTYQLDLRPTNQGLHRTLDWKREQTHLDATGQTVPYVFPDAREQARLAKLYQADPNTGSASGGTFSAVFAQVMPADIGGAGRYITYSSEFGDLRLYAERFRGDDNLAGQWDRRQRAIDVLVDVLLSWADSQLKDTDGAERVHAFIDRDLRRDTRNAILYAWLGYETLYSRPNEPPERAREVIGESSGFAVRLALYGVERGYVEPSEAPSLARRFQSQDASAPESLVLSIIKNQLLKLANSDAAKAALAPFDDLEALRNALLDHLDASAAARQRLAAWGDAVGLKAASPHDLLTAAVMELVRFPFLQNYDQLSTSLSLEREPILTNGRWDAEAKRVTWESSLPADPSGVFGLPAFAYAIWVEPRLEAQAQHLGAKRIDGDSLAMYAFWRAGLTPDEAGQWERFLATIKPRPDLAVRLRDFRFQGHEADAQPPQGVSVLAGAMAEPGR